MSVVELPLGGNDELEEGVVDVRAVVLPMGANADREESVGSMCASSRCPVRTCSVKVEASLAKPTFSHQRHLSRALALLLLPLVSPERPRAKRTEQETQGQDGGRSAKPWLGLEPKRPRIALS